MSEQLYSSLNNLSLSENETRIPNYVHEDLKYLAKCYTNNITEFDFSSNIDAMMADDICYIQEYPTYKILYKITKQYVQNFSKDIKIDQSLLQTYLDYYIEQLS